MNYFEDGSHYEDVKSLKFKIWDDLTIKTEIISEALKEAYLWGREEAAREIESAVIEVAGNSAATMEQAARIARGQ